MQSKDAFDVAAIDTPEHRAQMEAIGGELVEVDEVNRTVTYRVIGTLDVTPNDIPEGDE